MIIENWPLARFVDYTRKLRKNDRAVKRMTASITEFGFAIPVLATRAGVLVDWRSPPQSSQEAGDDRSTSHRM